MIKIRIETDGKNIFDSLDENKITLEECALVVYRLEQMRNYLLSKEFKYKFEIKSEDKADE